LTKGVFKVTDILPAAGRSEDEVLELAANAEAFSNHPIAVSIAKAYGKEVNRNELQEYEEVAGQGIRVNFEGGTLVAGNHKLMEGMGIAYVGAQERGTKVYLASGGDYIGCIVISDELKADAAGLIASLKSRGVRRTVMLTGDDPAIAQAIADELHLDEVHGGLLPAQKVEWVEALSKEKRKDGKLAFVGDGINDAPVLALADVGVAMGGLGSDAAIEASDVVLMTDEPSKLTAAVDIARFTKRIVWQNIIFALGVKGVFLVFGALGFATMWEAVFADVGVAMIAILNAMRVMRQGT
jgi:Cd2+/Zn2+-exporting ATPase